MFRNLRLQNLMPFTLPEASAEVSEVWKNDIQIEKGEHVLISAASGKGKSTLIAILYGLRSDFSGNCFINGIDSRLISPAQWSELRSQQISIVFQDLRLFPELSVLDNLKLKSALSQPEFDHQEAENMCRQLGILPLLQTPCARLSFGERQRVAIIRAMIPKAGLVLMDEPFSHLDRENSEKALELILRKTAENQATLLITSLGSDYGWKYDRILEL